MLGSNPKALAGIILLAGTWAWAGDEFLDLLRKASTREEPDEKIEYYTRAIAAWTPEHGRSLLAQCHFGRGEGYYGQNDLARSLPDLTRAVDGDPRNARALLLRGKIRMRRGEYARAAGDFEEAETIQKDPDALCGLGAAFEAAGRPDAAEKAYQEAADDPRAAAGLARIAAARKDLPKALKILDAADKAAEGRAPEVLALRGALRRSLADFERALALLDDRRSNLERAKAAPVELYEAEENLARAYESRGGLYESMSKEPEALADYEKACGFELKTACAKAEGLRRRKPMAPPPVKPVVEGPLAPPAEAVEKAPKKRYKKVRSDPGERYYGN